VSSVIRTANLLAVDAVEKAACDFFVESIEPSTACEALAFAAAHSECGEHARELHERCVGYVVEHFAECSAEPSFLELSCEAVAEVIGNDDLALGGHPVGAMAGNLGGAAQSTMHDFVQRRPLAQTQAAVATQATVVACGPPAAAAADHRRRATCDPDADGPLSVDGLPLRRDRIGQWVFPRSEAYPCVAISPSSPPGAVRLNDRRCAPQDEAVPG
jgi:hypothetical protein